MIEHEIEPSAVDLEKALLGQIILDGESINEIINLIQPKSFYETAHQEIFKAILQLFKEKSPIDILTLTNKLISNKQLNNVGGAYYISTLTSRVAGSSNIKFHALILKEKDIRRRCIAHALKLYSTSHDESKDIFETIDKAEKDLFDIRKINIINVESQQDINSSDAIDTLQKSMILTKNNKIIGIESGIGNIDYFTHGFKNGELTILAARPSVGKTGLECHIAKSTNTKVGIFSYESPARSLYYRMASGSLRIPYEKFTSATITDNELNQFSNYMQEAKSRIFINDNTKMTMPLIRQQSHKWVSDGIKIIFFDYLQIIPPEKKSGNREQDVSEISRGLKNLAMELDIPIVALCQLSRESERRADRKPKMSDLRESGSLEQDADNILLMYRPGYYTDDLPAGMSEGYTEVICPKQRNGKLFEAHIEYDMKYQVFENHGLQRKIFDAKNPDDYIQSNSPDEEPLTF